MIAGILIATGMLAFLAGIVMLVIMLVKKLQKKQTRIWLPPVLICVGFVAFIAGGSLVSERDKHPAETMSPPPQAAAGELSIVDFSITPLQIRAGGSANLKWNTTGAINVKIDQNIGNVSLSGNEAVSPQKTTVYTITVYGAKDKISRSVTLTVSPLLTADIKDFVQPTNPMVRDTAVGLISGAPAGINQDSQSWKIWQVNYWVAKNIDYVSDPAGHEYFATASETLDTKGGDCDDFAVLLASMYESIGLDAALASVDTDGNRQPDHLTCIVYYDGTGKELLEEVKDIMAKSVISTPTGQVFIKFVESKKSQLSKKYKDGIWVIADPPMAEVKDMVGYVTYQPYYILNMLDIGF